MGSGTWTLTGTGGGYPWHTSTITNLTFDAESSTIKTTGAMTTATSYFHGGGLTFNNVWIANTGTYAIQFTGSNTFNDLKIDPGRTVQFTANTTTTVSTFTSTATALATTSIGSITAAAHRLVKTGGGTISSDYLYISYSNATPTLTWYAGTHSVDSGNNTGWIFTAPPSSSVWQPRPGIISPSGGGFLMF